jgi:hypothetical protein
MLVKALLRSLALLTLIVTACARREDAQPSAGAASAAVRRVSTGAEAIAVVLADIQRRGGDPKREECSARKVDDDWQVTAWHIWYPDNKGSSRFVPGGFTTYIVATNGAILQTLPGL